MGARGYSLIEFAVSMVSDATLFVSGQYLVRGSGLE